MLAEAIRYCIEIVFNIALYINACLFIPQAYKIFKTKDAKGASLLTFLGFNIIQLSVVLHAYFAHDITLLLGMAASCITCGAVTTAILIHGRKRQQSAQVMGD